MPRRTLPRPQPGDFITAELFQQFFDEMRRLQINIGSNLNMIEGPGGISLRATCDERFFIQITGASATLTGGAIAYPWREKIPIEDGGWVDGPRTGTATATGDPAIESTGNTSVPLDRKVIASRVQGVLGFSYRECT